MPEFIKGLELSRLFYEEAVRPILEESFPDLRYAAAMLGTGSEVLGFDTGMSRDHGWGPRFDLFLSEEDYEDKRDRVEETLRRKLPHSFRGYPTSFTEPDPTDNGTQHLDTRAGGPVNHKVEVMTPRGFVLDYLDFDITRELEPADWLTFPEQKLRTLTRGAVFRDRIGLEDVRRRFAYYAEDVWLYLLGSAWARVGQEEHLMGRAGSVGDEIGSALIGARLVRDLMRLCFLMEKTYAPYPKWFGTAFAQLDCAPELSPHLRAALKADTWRERQQHLARAYRIVASKHNALRITEPLPVEPRDFFGRPFLVIDLHGYAEATLALIKDERVQRIAARRPVGNVDLFSDSTDLVSHASWRAKLRKLYE
ncbi:MAG TPA: DUF4037 domain-containing protein [Pyrinomonadaceae bacterium]|jgi:hypothetical protein|nr:DUF4037 domain-containing protein [Pyrinomonadaceae bacterium]